MKKVTLAVLVLMCGLTVQAQNAGQIIAAQYGEFKVPGSSIGGFNFLPSTCQVSGGGKNFAAFTAGTPIRIVDGNPSLTEVVVPSSVFLGACSVNIATVYNHVPPYYLTSGTGGLQEAIIANQTSDGPNTIILNEEWYRLIAPGTAATIIASVHGIADLGLEDTTTAPFTFYQWSGSQYVMVASSGGGGSSNYNQGSSGAVTETITAKLQQSLSVKDFGAVGDGAHLAADTAGLQAAVAAAASSGRAVYLPAGNYLLNNSAAPALSGAQNVMIYGDGPSSSLACQTVGGPDCIASTGATGFGLANLSISFGPAATTRSSGYALDVQSCTNCTFEGLTLNNGDLSGLRLASSTHTQIHNLKVSNFYANGLFMINDQDLRVDGVACSNNQDACFETSWFDSQYSAYSIPCQNITGTNITSTNDLETILVNACNNVSISNFSSIGAAKEAVFIGQDPTTTTLHWPDRVSISNGSIYGAGYGANPLNVATAPALYFNEGTSPAGFISHVAISNIAATHISGWGLQMAELQNTDLQLGDATFYDVGNGASGGDGCLDTEGNQVSLGNITCSDVGTYGLYDYNTNRLMGSNLNFTAVSQVAGSQSIFLSPTAVGFVNINGVSLNDTNTTTYASSIYDDTSSGLHSIFNIVSQGVVTPTGPTSLNTGTTFTYGDATHSYVVRNGGQIQSYAPPNFYFLPTAGTTPTSQVPGAVVYYQSKCRATPSGPEQTESVGWYDTYPTLTTESFAFNHFGGCSFPITLDFTAANSILEPQTTVTGTMSAQHLGGIASGTYAAVPTFAPGTGAGTSPTISANGQSNDVSGYISVTTGASPAASAAIVSVTFGKAYATLAKCSLWPANAAAAALSGAVQVYAPVGSNTAFSISSGTTALAASTLYTWGYACTQ